MPRARPKPPSPSSAQTPAQPEDPLAAFRARLESGRFNAVLGHALRRTIRDAAADTGLDAEVGAIRLGLARLLAEERDPAKLANGISRLTAVAVQAARLRQPENPEPDGFHAHLISVLAEIDAEQAAEAAARAAAAPLPLPAGDGDDPELPVLDPESPSPQAH